MALSSSYPSQFKLWGFYGMYTPNFNLAATGRLFLRRGGGCTHLRLPPRGAFGYFLGGYVPPGTPIWHAVLKKIFPKIDTQFLKWANFLYPVLEFSLKLIPHSRNGPIFYTPFQKVCKSKQPCFFKKIFLYLFDLCIK